MSRFPVPAHMSPLDAYTGSLQVMRSTGGEAQMSGEKDNRTVKKSDFFPNCSAYRLTVEVVRGERTKVLPDGQEVKFPEMEQKNVTVWSETPIDPPVGSYIKLVQPMIGVIADRNSSKADFYIQAVGIKEESVPGQEQKK